MLRALKSHYEIVLFRPIDKIRLIRGYSETEPVTGFFWGVREVIGGRTGPGLDREGRGGLWGNNAGDRVSRSGRRLLPAAEKSG
jgi:hypothetical protein